MRYTEQRREQAAETEKRILQTALELMREKGFDQVSVRDICREAGITTGAFYYHFSSKDALLNKGFAPLNVSMEQVLQSQASTDPIKRLRLIMQSYAAFMEESGELAARYYQRRMESLELGELEGPRYLVQAMENCFRQLQEMGRLPSDKSPQWMSQFFHRHFRGVVIDWVLHRYSYPLLPRMEEDFDLFTMSFPG